MSDFQPPSPDLTVDASGTFCPRPIIEAARAIQRVDPGRVLCVVATDPGIASDMPMWCRATRHEHLGTVREGRTWRSYVRRRAG